MTQAVALPASGDIEYTYEIVPTNFKEDRWVQRGEVRPTLRSNVHHAVVSVRPPDSNWHNRVMHVRTQRRTCITRLCTFARRIRTGCGTRLLVFRSPLRR